MKKILLISILILKVLFCFGQNHVYSIEYSKIRDIINVNIITHYKINTSYVKRIINNPLRNPNKDSYWVLEDYKELKIKLEESIELNEELGKKKCKPEIEKAKNYISILEDSISTYNNWRDSILLVAKQEKERIKIEKERQDSLRKVVDSSIEINQYRLEQDFINPATIANGIGIYVFNKKTVDNIFGRNYIGYRGGVHYYNIGESNIGLSFTDDGICYKMSLRYFGEMAQYYMQKVIDSGFILSKKEKTTNYEQGTGSHGFSQIVNGELRTYKLKGVICEVYDGSYMGFTFYRTE